MPLTPLEAVDQIVADAATLHAIVGALVGSWNVIAHSAVAVSHTGDTVETTLRDITIEAGAMGPNGLIRVTNLWTYTNSANIKNLKTRFGGAAGTLYSWRQPTTSAIMRDQFYIANRNAVNSQVGHPATAFESYDTNAGAIVTSAVDTTADVHLLVRCALANAGETITCEETLVELLKMA